jgi:hypothetical protein
MTFYNIQAFVLALLNVLSSNFLNSLIQHFQSFFLDGQSSPCFCPYSSLIQMTLSSCFLRKFEKMRDYRVRRKVFQSYHQTLISFLPGN